MLKHTFLVLTALAALAADDPWAKVRDLKSGTELRVFRKGAKQPTIAKLDELTAENLVVVVKNEQVAIPREEIDRIDQRPAGGSRVTKESKVTSKGPGDPDATRPGPPSAYPGSSTSSSTGLSIGSRGEFETVYRRPTGAPPRKP
jgi:hypothetical protein